MGRFLFATGIENSYPSIRRADGTSYRADEMEKTDHYRRWKEDFALVSELGISYLRYGLPYYRTHLAPGRYDWDFADMVFGELRQKKITPIVDLCHFGVPDWLGNFQNPEFPHFYLEYARAFAARYEWIRPIIGFTWYSLIDQVDWDTLLTQNNGRVNHYGLCDLERHVQPAGNAYRKLISSWREHISSGMLTLD